MGFKRIIGKDQKKIVSSSPCWAKSKASMEREGEHLLPTAWKTQPGIDVQNSSRRVIITDQEVGQMTGPAFCDKKGVVLKSNDMNITLHKLLWEIFVEHPGFFQSDVQSFADIEDKCSVRRSFQPGSDSLATAMKVSQRTSKLSTVGQRKKTLGQGRFQWM
jgi:hypothetical protein